MISYLKREKNNSHNEHGSHLGVSNTSVWVHWFSCVILRLLRHLLFSLTWNLQKTLLPIITRADTAANAYTARSTNADNSSYRDKPKLPI
jgi:hypothetical protein